MKQTISRQLYLARIAADLTQQQIAEKLNLSIPTIRKIESDEKIQEVSFGKIQKYCEEVGLEIDLKHFNNNQQ